MKKIEILEKDTESWENVKVNYIFLRAYIDSVDKDKEYFDFADVIWENNIDEIIENLKRFDIKEFTISSTYSGITEIIFEFQKRGCKLDGLIEIKCKKHFFEKIDSDDEFKKIPAFKLSIQ